MYMSRDFRMWPLTVLMGCSYKKMYIGILQGSKYGCNNKVILLIG